MKKQLIALSALIITFSSQCSSVQGSGPASKPPTPFELLMKADPDFARKVKEDPNFRATVGPSFKVTPKPKWYHHLYNNLKAAGLKMYEYAEERLPYIIDTVMQSPMAQRAAERAAEKLIYGPRRAIKESEPYQEFAKSKEEEDKYAYQKDWVAQMEANRKNATTEEERARATKKLQEFFDSPQGQEFALKYQGQGFALKHSDE